MARQSLSTQKKPLARLNGREVGSTPGIFILYQTNFGPPRYVGGSGQSLFDTLYKVQREGKYKYFRFMNTHTAEEAFTWESIYWHKAQASIDNSLEKGGHHPEPRYGEDWKCPMPGCQWEPAWKSQPVPEPVELEEYAD